MNGSPMDLVLAVSRSTEVSLVVKATVVVAAGLVAARVARRASASVRHVILTSTFGALLTLPLAAVLLPSLDVPFRSIPAPSRSAVEPVVLVSPFASGPWVSPTRPVASRASVASILPVSPSARVTSVVPVTPIAPPLPRGSASVSALVVERPLSTPRPRTDVSLVVTRVASVAWALGVMAALLPAAVGWWRLRDVRGSGQSWPRAQALVDACAAHAGAQQSRRPSRSIRALVSSRAAAPITFGLVRPVIVWPPDATTWGDDDLQRTIVHELEHVRRRDWLVHNAAYVTAALYWFHPLVWIARRRLGVEAERACDDAVLRGTDGPAYAEQLLRLARHLSTTVAQPGMSMANPSDLAIRVAALLDRHQARRFVTGRSAILMTLAATGLLVAVAPLRAVVAGPARVGVGTTAPATGAEPAAARTAPQTPGSLPAIPGGANVLVGRVLTVGSDDPVGGAVVSLIGYFDASGRPLSRDQTQRPWGSAPRQVLTTADGSFLFRDLPKGLYTLSVDAFGSAENAPFLQLIDLADRKTPTEATLRVWKTGTISGRVVDDHGEPVVGVTVTAFRAVGTASGLVLRGGLANADTDDRGAYRLASLQPGRYVVGVTSSSLSLPASLAGAIDATASNRDESWALTVTLLDGGGEGQNPDGGAGQRVGDFVLQRPGPPPVIAADGRMLTYPTTLYPGTATLSEAIVIPLGSGEDQTGIDFPIRFGPAVAVSGVATGPDGPMANLTVNLLPSNGAADRDYATTQTATGLLNWRRRIGVPQAITNASGAFRFLAVSPGAYVLEADVHTFPRPDSGIAAISLWTSQPLTIGDHDVAGLALTLTTGAHVIGRVTFKGEGGQALPPGDLTSWSTPMGANVRVSVNLQPVAAQIWRTGASWVEPDGTFATAGIAPGRYMVHANPPPGWTLESVTRGGQLAPDDLIDVDAADVTDVVITYTKTPTRVSGSVAGVNGSADDNADVFVFPADTTRWRDGIFPPATRRVRMITATSAGTFDVSGLPPGAYYLVAVAPRVVSDWEDPAFLDRLIPGATRVTLGSGETKTVSLVTTTPRVR